MSEKVRENERELEIVGKGMRLLRRKSESEEDKKERERERKKERKKEREGEREPEIERYWY